MSLPIPRSRVLDTLPSPDAIRTFNEARRAAAAKSAEHTTRAYLWQLQAPGGEGKRGERNTLYVSFPAKEGGYLLTSDADCAACWPTQKGAEQVAEALEGAYGPLQVVSTLLELATDAPADMRA